MQVTHRPPAPILRYVDQVAVASCETIEVRYAPAPLRRLDVDVIHVADEHLDTLIGVPNTNPLRWALATTLLVCLLRVGRVALVRRVDPSRHPRQGSWLTRAARGMLDRSTAMFVGFDETAALPRSGRFTVIPHAHFRDRFVGYPRAALVPGRVLCMSTTQLGPHVDAAVRAIHAAQTPGVTGRFAGRVPGEVADRLTALCAQHPADTSTRLDVMSDGAQVQEIDAAELILAPGSGSLEHLQVVFLALSLGRAVLVNRTDATERLADDTGEGWVHFYDDVVTGQDIDAALAASRAAPTSRPRLDGRDLDTVGIAYADMFRHVVTTRRHAHTAPHNAGDSRE